jgi:hypothetical protein
MTMNKPWLFLLLSFIIFSCTNNSKGPDVSGIDLNVKVIRFDQEFFSLDTNNLAGSLQRLKAKEPVFTDAYINFMTPVGELAKNENDKIEKLRQYIGQLMPLYDSVQKKYRDLRWLDKELTQELKYVKYYFPGFTVPKIYSTVEGFNPENPEEIYGSMYGNDVLVISLHMFLGENFSAYDPQYYFVYLKRRFDKEYISRNAMMKIVEGLFPEQQGKSLIEKIIEKGKQWWLLDRFMPNKPDSIKTGFTQDQLEWCKENEGQIWNKIIIDAGDLYTKDPASIQRYIGEGPHTEGMPEVSPGNIGPWVGLQIVKKFEEKNPGFKPIDLMKTPARQILDGAKYKPK